MDPSPPPQPQLRQKPNNLENHLRACVENMASTTLPNCHIYKRSTETEIHSVLGQTRCILFHKIRMKLLQCLHDKLGLP
jgi:hypothetical protein